MKGFNLENKNVVGLDIEKKIKELIDLGVKSSLEGRGDIALDHHNKALRLAKEGNKKRLISYCLHNIGLIYHYRGKYEDAIRNYQQSIQIYEEFGDLINKCTALNHIGSIYNDWGKYDTAIEYYKKSLCEYEEIDNKELRIKGIGKNLFNIGDVYWTWGRYDDAIEKFQQSLQSFNEIGEVRSKSLPLCGLGVVYKMQGRYKKAVKKYEQSLQISEEFRDIHYKGLLLMNIGEVYLAWGKHEEAIKYYRQSKQIFEEVEDIINLGWILNNIGEFYQVKKEYEDAIENFQQALQIFEKIGYVKGKSWVQDNFGKAYYECGKYEDASKYFQQALQIRKDIEDKKGKGETLNNIANLERQTGNLSKAWYYHKKALKIARELDAIHDIAIYSSELGKDYKEIGKNDKAFKYINESIENFRDMLEKTPIKHKQAFESKFKDLYDLLLELEDLIDKTGNIEPKILSLIHAGIEEIKKNIRQKGIENTKYLQKLDSIDEQFDRIEKWFKSTGRFLIETMGPLRIPVPILIEPSEEGGVLSTVKAYFKGKEQDIHFVCTHCGRIHVSKLKHPGKFFAHLSKIAGMFTIVGYIIPWVSGISDIITRAASKNQKLNDLFSELDDMSDKFKIPEIKEPQKIEIRKELNKITEKPPSIGEKERFWDHLEGYDMILCKEGCYNYICQEHKSEHCPFMD